MKSSPFRKNDIKLYIDLVGGDIVLTLRNQTGETIAMESFIYAGHVDKALLTTIDNLFMRNTLDRSALTTVELGQGVDILSSLGRIVSSIAAAVAASRAK